jgi:ArsR family transcriptional regulator
MKTLSNERLQLIASRARAMGDPTRIRILSVLERGEQPVGQIAVAAGTRQSTASKHLQVLFHAGLVQRRRDASAVFYWLSSSNLVRCYRFLAAPRLDAPMRAR